MTWTCACLALLAVPQQESFRLNPPTALRPAEVPEAVVDPAGLRLVWIEEGTLLFSRRLDGGPKTYLAGHPEGLADVRIATNGSVDPDQYRVVFRAATSRRAPYLAGVPIDGSAPAEPLASFSWEGIQEFDIDPSGTRTVMMQRAEPDQGGSLYAGPVVRPSTGPSGVRSLTVSVGEFRPHPDGQHVVCLRTISFEGGLRLVDWLGHSSSISGTLASGGRVERGFQILPSGSVAFRADAEVRGRTELWIATTAGVRRRVSAGILPDGDVLDFAPAPDGTALVYRGVQLTPGARELFAVSTTPGAVPVRLSTPLAANEAVLADYRIDPTSTRVLYRQVNAQGAVTLLAAPLDGSAPAIPIAWPVADRDGLATDLEFRADGLAVALRIAAPGEPFPTLWLADLTGATPPQRLSPPGLEVLDLLAAGETLVFRGRSTNGPAELYAVPMDSATAASRLHSPLPDGHAVLAGGTLLPGGDEVLARLDLEQRGVFRFHRFALDGASPIAVGPELASEFPTPVHDLVGDGTHLLYQGNQDLHDVEGLFSVPADGRETPVELSPPMDVPGAILSRELSADRSRVVFVQGGPARRSRLFAAPTDGHAAAVRLDEPGHERSDVLSRLRLTPDGARVVFLQDRDLDERFDLFVAPTDGRALQRRVNDPLVANRTIRPSFELSPDGTRVAFVSEAVGGGAFELFVAPLDGSAAPLRLTHATHPGAVVARLRFSTDGTALVLLGDLDQNDRYELHRVAADGSGTVERLSPPLVVGGDVADFQVLGNGYVLFRAEVNQLGRRQLYSVRLDGSAPPVHLGPPSGNPDVLTYWVAPGERRVLFLWAIGEATGSLYGADVEGGSPPQRLDSRHYGHPNNWDLRFTPDGSRAIYRLRDVVRRDEAGLFSVPVDGSRLPVVLQRSIVLGPAFTLTPDGSGVLYSGRVLEPDHPSQMRVPVDGPREASYELRAEPVDEMLFVGEDLVLRAGGELSGTRPARRAHRAPSPR